MTLRKKKLKSLIRFHTANKIDNYNKVGGGGEYPKEYTEQVKIKNNKCFS